MNEATQKDPGLSETSTIGTPVFNSHVYLIFIILGDKV